MAQEYTISAVSPSPPRTWSSSYGDMKSYKVKFAGEDIVVELNKRASSQPPKVGDPAYGDIQNSEYGYKFKSQQNPNRVPSASAPAKREYQPKDEAAIKAMWAIGQAVNLFTNGQDTDISDVEKNAKDFYDMVDRVKASGTTLTAPVVQPTKQDDEWLTEQEFPGSKSIDLSEIPFD